MQFYFSKTCELGAVAIINAKNQFNEVAAVKIRILLFCSKNAKTVCLKYHLHMWDAFTVFV